MKMDNQEFEKFIEELYNSFEKYGIPRRVATTIISEAIYVRESSIANDKETKAIADDREKLYGPPPTKGSDEEKVTKVVRSQILYGSPPPSKEVMVNPVEQMLYGPPPIDTEIDEGKKRK